MGKSSNNYSEAVRFLYRTRFFGMKLGLQNIRHILAQLQSPENSFTIVHIAGTNGKGSVAALLDSILREAGYCTGLFTSPHISTFRERFRINGDMISRDDVIRLVNTISPIAGKMKELPLLSAPTFFEIVTAMAAQYFAENKVDIAIIETGLGGRLDATNAFPSKVAVITGIGLEHQEHLGNTIEQIAAEKAGIIKESEDVVVSKQEPTAYKAIEKEATAKKAILTRVGNEIKWTNRRILANSQFADILLPTHSYKSVESPLIGSHQADNLCAAIGAIETLRKQDYKISEKALYEGIRRVKWPARFEVVPGNPVFVLDTAANPHAAETVASTLVEWKKSDAPVLLLLGMLADKDVLGTGRILIPLANEIVLTRPESDRALAPEELREKLAGFIHGYKTSLIPSLSDALKYASGRMENRGGIVLIAGSLFLMGKARELLGLAPLEDDFPLTDSISSVKKESL